MYLKKFKNLPFFGINNKALLSLILLGVVFRIFTLKASGLWFDEALQFRIAKEIVGGIPAINRFSLFSTSWVLFKRTSATFLGSPAFTVLLHYWAEISDAELWLRMPPLVF